MRIAIIDADLIGRKKHRFPNLACMKLSGYHKELGDDVVLKLDYECLQEFDAAYISKVFTNTECPNDVLTLRNVIYGGTGFFYEDAKMLCDEIEHHMPDCHLYDEWIEMQLENGIPKKELTYYTDYSIGFLTRGCFRKCEYCVNKKYDRAFINSSLDEFYDESRRKICLLDDNVFSHKDWKRLFNDLISTNKPFVFKQGLDVRLLTDEKCQLLFNCKYDGDYIFAFDNIEDYDLVHEKLKLIRKYSDSHHIKFYVLVGYNSTDLVDIENMWKRIALLMQYKCAPFIMKYQGKDVEDNMKSEENGIYVSTARWCNQPKLSKRISFREFCNIEQNDIRTSGFICKSMRALRKMESANPSFAPYFDLKFGE